MKYDVIIVGAGIAGMTAALYLKRSNKKVLVIEKSMPGGAINTTSSVKNYPGIKEISGPDLAMLLFEQIKENDIEIIFDTVKNINVLEKEKVVQTQNQSYLCEYLILATGKENRKLNVPREKELTGHGVSYCALCDAPLFKDKKVIVVGTGDSALEEALYLSTLCEKVTIMAKYDYFKCQDYILEEVKKTKNIKIIYSAMIEELEESDGRLSAVKYKKDNKIHRLSADGVFVYIGSTPNIFTDLNMELDGNYIKVDSTMKTSVNGVYACGDIVKKDLYQLVTAASDGAIAATSIIKELNRK